MKFIAKTLRIIIVVIILSLAVIIMTHDGMIVSIDNDQNSNLIVYSGNIHDIDGNILNIYCFKGYKGEMNLSLANTSISDELRDLIKIGNQISFEIEGPILESYPVQARASTITGVIENVYYSGKTELITDDHINVHIIDNNGKEDVYVAMITNDTVLKDGVDLQNLKQGDEIFFETDGRVDFSELPVVYIVRILNIVK